MPETVPYGAFNFLVDLGTGSAHGPDAGFEECGPIAEELEVIEYRNGNDAQSEPRKLPGQSKVTDVTLKRGVIGTATLYGWFDEVRTQGASAARTVTITLLGDDHATQVMIWKLIRAWPVRYSAGPLHGRANMVALEELTLTYERLEVETA
jgi:phage tail-like protein